MPLWSLVLAVQLVDVAWALLVLAGVERVRIDPGLPSNPLLLDYMPFTHGLPATLLWCLAAFVGARQWLRETVPAVVLALAVGSHWLLDLLVHRPDLPLWGDAYKVGFALWDHPPAALGTELGILLASAFLLARSPAFGGAGSRSLGAYAGGLVLAHLAFTWGPPPPGPAAMALSAGAFFGFAAWWAARVEVSAPSLPEGPA